jgi:CRP-like cAMP-binding protein
MLESRNFLLAGLEREERERLLSDARLTPLRFGDRVFEPDQQVEGVFFPETGVISIITEASNGEAAEGGVVGVEGAAGLAEALGSGCMASLGTVQADGKAWLVHVRNCRELHRSSGRFRALAARSTEFQMVESRQSLLCRSYHHVEQRLARWLLEMADRSEVSGGVLTMTQEILGVMLAVQRSTVSTAAHQLKTRGLIDYTRGQIRLLKVEELERLACPCRHAVRIARHRILRDEPWPASLRRSAASI